ITKRRQAEEEREKLEARLLQAQKMEAVGTLAGGIAHDFNNLLMGIQGQASLMLLDIAPDHPHYERLKSIENTVQTGAGLSKQLLGFARGGRYEVKPTNLNELIKHSSEMFARTQKNITINEKYYEDIWTVEVDQGQINQVLLNLYVNAWQALPEGGSIYIETSNVELEENYSRTFSIKPGNYVKISVTDTGVGIDKAIQHKVFEPFFTTREIGRGTGLGLASAYGIIKNHGGIINIYSEKGKGTTFTLHLPVSEKQLPIIKKKLDKKIQKGTETILLVDDEDMIIDVGKDMLEQLGYKVLSAKTGEKAIEIYRKHKDNIDMAIVDLIMPSMSGGDVYNHMKEINPDIKVLLASGYCLDRMTTDILNRGCKGFIQKPFDISELSTTIRKILGKK
ncbi:MAG: ATP-binding protein, partial [Desulfobacterales bacterium]|nr:ATP-binding protein [Desulfobacterales bacterium]